MMYKTIILFFFLSNFLPVLKINAQTALKKSYPVGENKARRIVDKVLASSPVIDGHNDLFIWYYGCRYKPLQGCPQDIADYPINILQVGHTDIPRWRKGGVGGVQLNVFADSLSSFLDAYDLLYRMEKEYSNDLKIVGSSAETKQAIKEGKIAIIPSLEGAIRLENKFSYLRTFYKLGLRSVTFTYHTSDLADGSDDKPLHDGISSIGARMVKEMNELGIIIDISHASSETMSDILRVSKAPVIFSHSNVRALCNVKRNVPDSILHGLKSNGGIIMIDLVPEHTSEKFAAWMKEGDSLYYSIKERYPNDAKLLNNSMEKWEKENPQPEVTVRDVADHFDYVKEKIGVDYIGIGGDFDGITFTIKGLEDVSCFPALLVELAKRGWTESELMKITGENYLRVFEKVELISQLDN